MAKPTTEPEWASDDEYPAGAEDEAGEENKTEPLAGKKEAGWRPAEKPRGQYMNWWMNLVWLWIVWLNGVNTRERKRVVQPRFSTTFISEGAWIQYVTGAIVSNGSGTAMIPFDCFDEGDQIKSVEVRVNGNGATDVDYTLDVADQDDGSDELATLTDTNRSATPVWLNIFTGSRVLAPGEALRLQAHANGVNYVITRIRVTYVQSML